MSALPAPAVAGAPRLILRFEGAALLAAAAFGYWMTGASWCAICFFSSSTSAVVSNVN